MKCMKNSMTLFFLEFDNLSIYVGNINTIHQSIRLDEVAVVLLEEQASAHVHDAAMAERTLRRDTVG